MCMAIYSWAIAVVHATATGGSKKTGCMKLGSCITLWVYFVTMTCLLIPYIITKPVVVF